jgi:acyl-CoA synthetase (AMP-forming)/AMP-acid ligase II
LLTTTVLPFALPAAAAGLAYVNARHGVAQDLAVVYKVVRAAIDGSQNERRDTLNLFYALEAHATSNRSGHPWIIFQGQTWTYAQGYDVVLRYGSWLKSQGVEKDDIVAMDFVNSETFIWVWFGLWSIGAKPAFINTNLTGTPWVHTIKTSTARLVLVDENAKDKFQDDVMKEHGFTPLGERKFEFEMDTSNIPRSVRSQTTTSEEKATQQLQIIQFDKALEAQILTCPPTRQPDSARQGQIRTSMAMLIYTSGTTGLPKAAVMPWGKCSVGAKVVSQYLSLGTSDVLYTSMPLYHSSASVLGVCACLRAGSTISLSAKFSHKTFWPEVRASRATILHYVGETCRYLLAAPPSPLDTDHHLRAAFGNGLRPDIWESFKSRFAIQTIYEFYAATEAPGALFNNSTNSFSSGAIGRNGTLGNLLFSRDLCVIRMTPDAAPSRSSTTGLCDICAPGEAGELLYKLDPAKIKDKFQGYFNNASANDSKILRDVKVRGDAWYRSGDLMRHDSEHRWWFVDRLGDTFRWKAENVSTAEVADALGRHDAILEANVYGVQVPGYDGRAGCAAVVLRENNSSDEVMGSIAKHVEKELPGFARPVWLRVTKEMATTGTNKLQKTGLQKEGIEVEAVEKTGDVLFWLSEGRYVRFGKRDLERVKGGGVKL